MNREVHVRFCEGMGVKFPRATRPLIHSFGSGGIILHVEADQEGQKWRLKYLK